LFTQNWGVQLTSQISSTLEWGKGNGLDDDNNGMPVWSEDVININKHNIIFLTDFFNFMDTPNTHQFVQKLIYF